MKNLKRILLPILAIGFFISCSSDSTTEDVQTIKPASEENAREAARWPSSGSVGVTWQFGRNSRGCDGIGICRSKPIKITATIAPLPPVTVYEKKIVSIAEAPDPRTLHLEFDEDYIRSVRLNCGEDVITLEEDFVIELETTRMIGLPEGFTIRAGRYPVVLNRETGRYDCFIR